MEWHVVFNGTAESCKFYWSPYEPQVAERGSRRDGAHVDAQPKTTDYDTPPTLVYSGAAPEVDEAASRLFPNLAMPPPTDPSLGRSIIKRLMMDRTGLGAVGDGITS